MHKKSTVQHSTISPQSIQGDMNFCFQGTDKKLISKVTAGRTTRQFLKVHNFVLKPVKPKISILEMNKLKQKGKNHLELLLKAMDCGISQPMKLTLLQQRTVPTLILIKTRSLLRRDFLPNRRTEIEDIPIIDGGRALRAEEPSRSHQVRWSRSVVGDSEESKRFYNTWTLSVARIERTKLSQPSKVSQCKKLRSHGGFRDSVRISARFSFWDFGLSVDDDGDVDRRTRYGPRACETRLKSIQALIVKAHIFKLSMGFDLSMIFFCLLELYLPKFFQL